jgi:hypothetical protein
MLTPPPERPRATYRFYWRRQYGQRHHRRADSNKGLRLQTVTVVEPFEASREALRAQFKVGAIAQADAIFGRRRFGCLGRQAPKLA